MRSSRTDVKRELERIAAECGGQLRPAVVVDEAQDPESPLHDEFEWDDTVAAQQHRLDQARRLIRLIVTYEPPTAPGESHRVWVSLTSDRRDRTGYRLVTTVMADVERRAQLLADARAEMRVFQRKYRILSELAQVFAAMTAVERALEPHDAPAQDAQVSA